ncbi:hypothetical protein V2J09_023536 [Rumex salicifolius]
MCFGGFGVVQTPSLVKILTDLAVWDLAEEVEMSSLSRELVFLILQFLDEEKFKETVHRLEKESGFYFNMRYFEEAVTNGEWDDVEKYLSGFTKVDDNRYSMKIFFEIRKQKYLEALDRREPAKAVEILVNDLKVFSTFNEDLFKEITLLLTLSNFRENEQLSKYGDTKSARAIMLVELKKLIEANPLFRDKLHFPSFKNSRLRTLINQSLNWQHQLCKNPRPNPDIKTLFVDHSCAQPNGARAPSPVTNSMVGSMPKVGGFPPLGAHGPFQPGPAPLTASLAGWMANPTAVPHQAVSAGPVGLAAGAPSNAAAAAQMLKRPRTPPANAPPVDYQTADSEYLLKRTRPFGIPDEGNNVPVNILPISFPGQSHHHNMYSPDDLPKIVVANLNQGSAVKCMDFHPHQQSLLLVGTNIGDVSIWEISSKSKLVTRNFKVWDVGSRSVALQAKLLHASLQNEYTASVNRVRWNNDGALLGVAYSKHIVQVYSYTIRHELGNVIEIEAHVGNVSDLAFAHPNKLPCLVTCGEDKTIKVWDALNGAKLHTFEGHEAPVYSVCPHHKETIQFIFSTATDGKIKAWLYDNAGSRVDYDAPGHSCTTMAYTADGARLFSCGTNKEGESFLVEWNESEGAVKRAYNGLGKRSIGVVQFDTTKNRFLAAGDEFLIKIWDMDHPNPLTTIDADGGLPASPSIRFCKEGLLLAVSTNDNGIKVLANADGVRLIRSLESRNLDASRSSMKGPLVANLGPSSPGTGTNVGFPERSVQVTGMVGPSGDSRSLADVKPRSDDLEKSRIWKLTEINEPSQLRSLRLPDQTLAVRIMRLIYTNSGSALLALAGNAVHKLWKWQRNERNATVKATTGVPPQLWQPSSGILMTNEIGEANLEEAVPCFALSKNDSYTMTTFMAPPPAATSLAFHPQDNNVIAIGMDDSTIQIYNVRVDEVKSKLKGHQKKVTGLAFSNALNVLVSSGADSQLCVWSTDGWEKQASKFLQIPSGRPSNPQAPTRVQFHQDQTHLLVVHESQVAIYEAPKLECVKQVVPMHNVINMLEGQFCLRNNDRLNFPFWLQWIPPQSMGAITDAAFSCDSQSIYVCLEDGNLAVLVATTLTQRCMVNPAAYMPTNTRTHPNVIAAHPSESSQFAVGLTDGSVHVIEPLEAEGKWGPAPPAENGPGPSISSATAASDQPSSGNAATAKSAAIAAAKHTLREKTVREIAEKKRRLVEVPYTATLAQTMNSLVANRVVALPVAAPPGHWIGAGGSMIMESDKFTGIVRKHYIGMVTMLDILAHISGDDDEQMDGGDTVSHLDDKLAAPVSSIIGHCLEGLSLWTLNPNTSILDSMEVMGKGIHRAMVPLDGQSPPENVAAGVELADSASSYKIISQMDILRFLRDPSHSRSLYDTVLSRSISESGAVSDTVFAVTDQTKAIDAVRCVRTSGVHAVPVVAAPDLPPEAHKQLVNGRGRQLVGTFSATDLRGCPVNQMQSWLSLNVIDFATRVYECPSHGARDLVNSPRLLVTCHMESTLAEVIDKAVTQHVHRLWVVDAKGLLLGLLEVGKTNPNKER